MAKRGAHLFAAGAASEDVAALVAQLRDQGIDAAVEGDQAFVDPSADGQTGFRVVLSPGGADTLFLHASTLGGIMLGISRPTQAWQWSGHPERVEARS